MKRLFFVLMIVAVSVVTLTAEVKLRFPELNKPNSLSMDKENIYIGDGASVYIIDKATGKVKNKFGKEGLGPQEFNTGGSLAPLQVFPREKDLVINSISKLSFFSKEGKYIDELNTKAGQGSQKAYFPFLDHFTGYEFNALAGEEAGIVIGIYNKDLQLKKELAKLPPIFKGGKASLFREAPIIKNLNDRIFFCDGTQIKITVFNLNGEKVFSFSHPWEPVPFTAADEKEAWDFFKTYPPTREAIDVLKNIFVFPKVFPAMRDFSVDGKNIYILTYKKDKKGNIVLTFDIKGKFIKSASVPYIVDNLILPNPSWMEQGKFYQLVEDIDEEVWELHVHSLGI